MLRPLLLTLMLLLGACAANPVDMMQAPPAALRGASYIHQVDLSLGPDARKELAAADAKVKPLPGYAGMPFAQMLPALLLDAARARGMAAGRPLTVTIELDHLNVPGTAGAFVGGHDRLASAATTGWRARSASATRVRARRSAISTSRSTAPTPACSASPCAAPACARSSPPPSPATSSTRSRLWRGARTRRPLVLPVAAGDGEGDRTKCGGGALPTP